MADASNVGSNCVLPSVNDTMGIGEQCCWNRDRILRHVPSGNNETSKRSRVVFFFYRLLYVCVYVCMCICVYMYARMLRHVAKIFLFYRFFLYCQHNFLQFSILYLFCENISFSVDNNKCLRVKYIRKDYDSIYCEREKFSSIFDILMSKNVSKCKIIICKI